MYGHLKCDELQVPAPGPFNFDDLTWYNKQAWIPKSRLRDFLKGEECRDRCNTCLKTLETVVRNKELGLCTLRYWCSYGPDDAREKVRPDVPEARVLPDGQVPLRKTTENGQSTRRGCRYHFTAIFKQLERPDAYLLKFAEFRHVDTDGLPCHGFDDPTAIEARAHIAPHISIECRESIERLLRTGVSPLGILKAQQEELREYRKQCKNDKSAIVWTRDMLLDYKDIQNVLKSINSKKDTWASDDAKGLKLWVEANEGQVLLYQERNEEAGTPFLFVFASE
ncbi:unnamed protein product [Calypogeia fissa]